MFCSFVIWAPMEVESPQSLASKDWQATLAAGESRGCAPKPLWVSCVLEAASGIGLQILPKANAKNLQPNIASITFVSMEEKVLELERIARQVRRDIVRMVHGCQSGHPGGSLGCADLLVALYFNEMKHNPSFSMEALGEDVFFLSNGHISPVWYSVLARSGYFPIAELASFRRLNSRLQGHPATKEHLPGIRVASGSLGQGLSVASGMALAKRVAADDSRVFCLMGDGELQEGQVWEAAMFAAHNRLDKLVAVVDWNGQQIDGPTAAVCDLGNLPSKWAAFGWDTFVLENGNDMKEVLAALSMARNRLGKGKPVCILMKTQMGSGVDFMMGSHAWHGIAPNDEQLAAALAQLEETLGDY